MTGYADEINEIIHESETEGKINTDNISDGSHTFGELYKHRCYLFACICNQNKHIAWKSKKHIDGSMYEGYFIVGINTPTGVATYHYSMEYWDLFHIKEIPHSPEYDGYTPDDVLDRLLGLEDTRTERCDFCDCYGNIGSRYGVFNMNYYGEGKVSIDSEHNDDDMWDIGYCPVCGKNLKE